MGVRKFRSVEQMPGPPARPPLDPENLRIAFGLASIASGFAPVRYAAGVRRFHSWPELLEHRERPVREPDGDRVAADQG